MLAFSLLFVLWKGDHGIGEHQLSQPHGKDPAKFPCRFYLWTHQIHQVAPQHSTGTERNWLHEAGQHSATKSFHSGLEAPEKGTPLAHFPPSSPMLKPLWKKIKPSCHRAAWGHGTAEDTGQPSTRKGHHVWKRIRIPCLKINVLMLSSKWIRGLYFEEAILREERGKIYIFFNWIFKSFGP